MRFFLITIAILLCLSRSSAQDPKGGPVSEKAQKAYKEGIKDLQERQEAFALDEFKKADKQDGGQCLSCQQKMVKYGMALRDWKTAELGAEEMASQAKGERDTAVAHYQFAIVLFAEGTDKHKDEYFSRVHDEIGKALAAYANFPDAIFLDGKTLANLHQDDAATAKFEQFLKMKPGDDPDHQRALRFVARPELARARMAPAFSITTLDGNRISMDDLQGKVVLLDFWATWCGPCRREEALLEKLEKEQGRSSLAVVRITNEAAELVKAFLRRTGENFPSLVDGDSAIRNYEVRGAPTLVFVEKNGRITGYYVGFLDESQLRAELQRVEIREQKP